MKLVRAALGDDADLTASGRSTLRRVESRADTEFGNRFERNLQPRFRLLGLFLDSAGIDAVEGEVVVVARAAVEANVAFGPARSVDRSGREHHQRREGTSV